MAKSSRNFLIFVALLALLLRRRFSALESGRRTPAWRSDSFPDSRSANSRATARRFAGEGELNLAAKGAIVIDALTGKTLYERNADQPQYPGQHHEDHDRASGDRGGRSR